jgi:hypothetical protein
MPLLQGNKNQYERYLKLLKCIWSLSNLFSESNTPYLYYRAAENIFCSAFNADNLSRSDCTADARLNKIWYWLKTFTVSKDNSIEKIAEFNSERSLYSKYSNDLWLYIKKISELRNYRIQSTMDIHWINEMYYHCVARFPWKFSLHEERMNFIDIKNIWWIERTKSNDNIIVFNDKINEYRFNISKSTLYKRFFISPIITFDVDVFENPLALIEELFDNRNNLLWNINNNIENYIILPLYSRNNIVYPRSWLNQRNAWWRARNFNEVYIPIPAIIHKKYPNFLPGKDTPFNLHLPNWEVISAKVCQEWWKALMSNPNSVLWERLLRTVLHKTEWSIVTYEDLENIWVDSVELYKKEWEYYINFKSLWTYDEFIRDK